ncbi:uncharacterized protein K489DRAFT_140609 [Dissoconium aciculare CBS 342.82]|uniref:Uncharacterized protein n=1 Tax=Dissoconium aciculare CBS 342.82 TaxID=1314786 RepID=A0A6J3LPN1_9PEZI|nr:uncharacterized protein K489DRAFT_140609 [Dissoconium aciculare CBS 342.82]KAF1817830.1 hypothetical protein K489DRAFT_140609 [Dissoconium aciculare CBS 342.82]
MAVSIDAWRSANAPFSWGGPCMCPKSQQSEWREPCSYHILSVLNMRNSVVALCFLGFRFAMPKKMNVARLGTPRGNIPRPFVRQWWDECTAHSHSTCHANSRHCPFIDTIKAHLSVHCR